MMAKKVFLCLIVFILIVLLYKSSTFKSSSKIMNNAIISAKGGKIQETSEVPKETKIQTNMKYILLWTPARDVPFQYMGEGQKGFIERDCPYVNCIVTGNRAYLGDYSKFDVIAFAGPAVVNYPKDKLPERRSPHQKYVFAGIESADNYPVCSNRFDGYFNWTWTFKLDSQVRWGYFSIWDKNNKIVGPNKIMHWIKLEDMDPVSDEFKEELKTKHKAAAWFVSNCFTRSKRENFVKKLQEELKIYELEVDIFGDCGNLKCSRKNEAECDKVIKDNYYFYLSFENSFSEDYVTEKLLHALEADAVPIVYGGANYTRFMPDGIYLNARELGVKKLAAKMNELIKDPEQYAQYFRWKNHYSYLRKFRSAETNEYCLFCTTLNNEDMVKDSTVYQNFRNWWDPPGRC